MFFNIILKVLVISVRQEKEIKGVEIGKEEIKLSLITDDVIVYVENHKESIKTLLELNNDGKVTGYKVITQKTY